MGSMGIWREAMKTTLQKLKSGKGSGAGSLCPSSLGHKFSAFTAHQGPQKEGLMMAQWGEAAFLGGDLGLREEAGASSLALFSDFPITESYSSQGRDSKDYDSS